MDLFEVAKVAVLGVLGFLLAIGLTWLLWTIVVEALRAVAAWIIAREAERVMSLEPGPERSDRSKRLLAGLSRFDAATSTIYIPPVRQRLVVLVAYGVVIALIWLAAGRFQLP